MSRHDKPLSCARTQVLLEAYVDGDLLTARRQRVERHLHTCVDCQAALAAAQHIQMTLRELPALQAPAAVRDRLAALLPQADGVSGGRASAQPHWQDRIAALVSHAWEAITGKGGGAAAWLRPAGAVAVLLLVVFLWAQQRHSASQLDVAQVSEEELLDAQAQARWAVAYLARITAGAGDTAFIQVGEVMSGVIGEHVMGSVTNAVDRSLQPRSEKKEPGTVQEEVQAP